MFISSLEIKVYRINLFSIHQNAWVYFEAAQPIFESANYKEAAWKLNQNLLKLGLQIIKNIAVVLTNT